MSSTAHPVSVSDQAYGELEELAKITDEPIEEALAQAIAERLDVQRWQVAQIQAAKVKADGGGKFVSSNAMSDWAQSLGTGNEKPIPEARLTRND